MKHSKTTLKLQNKLAITEAYLTQIAKQELKGLINIMVSVKFDNFPNSLMVHCYFTHEQHVNEAKLHETRYQKLLHKQLLQKGIVLKNSKYNLAFVV